MILSISLILLLFWIFALSYLVACRETQLRAFYSTTEEIQVLFAKQQKQLKAMQRTLEDEENYGNTSLDIDMNPITDNGNSKGSLREKEAKNGCSNAAAKVDNRSHRRDQVKTSSDEASVTEKHDCNIRNQQDAEDTQEVEYIGAERTVKGAFGSDIDGVVATPVLELDPVESKKDHESEGVSTAPNLEGYLLATERVVETESPGLHTDGHINLNKCSATGEDTMQLDDDTNLEGTERAQMISQENLQHSQTDYALAVQNTVEDTQVGCSIKTSDLLASEVPGSWAYSTAPSIHGENDSPNSKGNVEEGNAAALHDCGGVVSESQNAPSSKSVAARWSHEHQALSEMIGIVAPELKEQFSCAVESNRDQKESEIGAESGSDTEGCSNNDNDHTGDESEAETIGSDRPMEEDDEATQQGLLLIADACTDPKAQ